MPSFVMATTGSTVLGSCDDLNAIADVCEKYGIWMHVDVIVDLTISDIKPNHMYVIYMYGVFARVSWENDMSKVCNESTHLGRISATIYEQLMKYIHWCSDKRSLHIKKINSISIRNAEDLSNSLQSREDRKLPLKEILWRWPYIV